MTPEHSCKIRLGMARSIGDFARGVNQKMVLTEKNPIFLAKILPTSQSRTVL
jgi:hypothetical protein